MAYALPVEQQDYLDDTSSKHELERAYRDSELNLSLDATPADYASALDNATYEDIAEVCEELLKEIS